ncbi:hypothetical protein QT327_07070 [Olivibacter sp. 47]|uniref:MoaD/ThiS family protein n=1 Tax=Olivibacter sp. 47 TaxID=3056486 RepID=UPI0025A3E2EA|nr:MoaD/ThiS family protein [Olivibacter sp. 47]MDM8174117.1 hypothetical protein [Olivibacter sp. 47]
MKVKIQIFRSLIELLNKESSHALDVDGLLTKVIEQRARLDGRELLVAVNNTIVQKNIVLQEGRVENK